MTLVLNPVNADDAPSLMYPVKVVETSDPWYFLLLCFLVCSVPYPSVFLMLSRSSGAGFQAPNN